MAHNEDPTSLGDIMETIVKYAFCASFGVWIYRLMQKPV